ncbi:MAG: XdhC family protein [Nitrososphaerota archaeon]|nr:XdhC family protein [Nitrososphaerota archaeon]MDG7023637.1 XdhC family protein [Nitrososphaerota archaeon]
MKQAEFAKMMDSLATRGAPFAVATVVKTEGSSLGKPGFKVIISGTGEVVYGSLGGVCPESAIAAVARKTIRTGTPKMVQVFLESVEDSVGAVLKSQNEDEIHVETNCGGSMEIYVEPYLPQQRLVLIGQGGKDDVEDALVKLGKSLDFDVVVIDHSPVLTEQPDQVIKDVDYDVSSFEFQSSDSVIVLTKGERDLDILRALSNFKLRYVGMLASHQRARDNASKLREAGVDERFVSTLRSPAGADIGAVAPTEIALSIMAEVVAQKYGKEVPHKTPDEGDKGRKVESQAD